MTVAILTKIYKCTAVETLGLRWAMGTLYYAKFRKSCPSGFRAGGTAKFSGS
jgi:hypothetical protein